MKQSDWRKVYPVPEEALDARVRAALGALSDQPVHRAGVKRALVPVLAALLVMGCACALAAGLLLSGRVDLQTRAEKALLERYGLTHDMLAVFHREVDEEAGTVTFIPMEETSGQLASRLGEYRVRTDGGGMACAWTHDGEDVGGDLTSDVWDAKLLAEALRRRKAGEEWFELLWPQEQLVRRVTEAEAEALAREAVAAEYGEGALEGFALEDVNPHVVGGEQMALDGHGIWRYSVIFVRADEEARMEARYKVEVFADDGGVSAVSYAEDPLTNPSADAVDEQSALEKAFPVASVAPGEAIALAREALRERYGLTQAQTDALALNPSQLGFALVGDRPVYCIGFWLWLEDGVWSDGNGLYTVMVNVENGVIEETYYDSGLGGNG